MKTEKKLITIKILEEKLKYIDDKLSMMVLAEETNEQSDLLIKTKDEILSELLFYEIQDHFKKIENQFQTTEGTNARENGN